MPRICAWCSSAFEGFTTNDRGCCSDACARAWNAKDMRERRHAAVVDAHAPEYVEKALAGVRLAGDDDCWPWLGRLTAGYGRLYVHYGYVEAHVWFYEELVGPVPEGHVLDHLCHTRDLTCRAAAGKRAADCQHRRCCNPHHLEPVTRSENLKRGDARWRASLTECKHGHPFTEENTYVYLKKDGRTRRMCKTCNRASNQRATIKVG